MTQSFIHMYKLSSDCLINAMKELVRLISIDGMSYRTDMRVMELMHNSKLNNNLSIASVVYNEKMEIINKRAKSVMSINNYISSSIDYLLKMIEIAFEDTSLVQEVSLCHKHINAISDFVNKDYLIKDISIPGISQRLLLFMLRYENKKNLPQFKLILDRISRLCSILEKPESETQVPVPCV